MFVRIKLIFIVLFLIRPICGFIYTKSQKNVLNTVFSCTTATLPAISEGFMLYGSSLDKAQLW